jgi:hypothetical protein
MRRGDLDALVRVYDEQGWVCVPDLFSPADVARMRWRIERLVDGAAESLVADGLAASAHASEPFGRRLMALVEEAGAQAVMLRLGQAREVVGAVFGVAKAHGPQADEAERDVFDTVTHPEVLDVLEALMGPTISYSYAGIMRVRLPDGTQDSRDAKPFPFHQDSQYFDDGFGVESKAKDEEGQNTVVPAGLPSSTQHLHIITVWAPLVDTDATNGALTLVPGSHRWGQLDGQRDADGNMQAYHLPERARVEGAPRVVEDCPAGGAIFFNNLVFHGSGPNSSNAVRWSLDWRYDAGAEGSGPASMGGTPAAKAAAEWWRGQFSVPGRLDYGPFLVRDRARQLERPSWESWVARRHTLLAEAGVPVPAPAAAGTSKL